jgi:heme/copper-type cytochrome/quinol oxidase subunit 3
MWWAESGIRAGRSGRLRIGPVITIVFGAIFAAIQAVEWSKKLFGPATDAYGSLFFTITGFHGAHVIVGLIMLTFILLRASLGHFTAERHLAVSTVAIYWHFVDVVWLFVFASLFLMPRL